MRYAAIGDSFTEGVGDEPVGAGPRGWADLVAAGLAVHHGEPIDYVNLAVRGRLLTPVVTEQLDTALALDPPPTLITLNGGGNDLLRPGVDIGRLAVITERAVLRCAMSGVRLVLISGADPSHGLPLGRVVHERAAAFTVAVAHLAERYDLDFVDVFNDIEIRRPGYWSADRLHLGEPGHRRVAELVLAELGAVPAAGSAAPPDVDLRPGAQLRYYREHVLPWVGRRIRGRSSGDGRTAKYPTWVSVAPGTEPHPASAGAST